MNILITGVAGFIGSHCCDSFSKDSSNTIIGIDSFNDFYNPLIKEENIKPSLKNENVTIHRGNLLDFDFLSTIFSTHSIDIVIHLAAYAGVRPSIDHPKLYYDHNITSTLHILELCKKHQVRRLCFASSSSVYGNNKKIPFSETDPVNHPISPYAATKKAGELMCYNYHHLYGIETACIRFFTVYGPRQRPEMAIHKFTDHIFNDIDIPIFNQGNCFRDYTYIDDIVQGIQKIAHSPKLSYDIINLGESKTISTSNLISLIEVECNKKANITLLPAQPGDVDQTYADISHAQSTYGYEPTTSIEEGIKIFIQWYKNKKINI